jgi:DNA-binding XRE family transcriptional regulator
LRSAGALFVCVNTSVASSKEHVLKINAHKSGPVYETVPPVSESRNPQPALGAAVRAIRDARGKTQQDTAQAAGITVAHLSKIERGLTNPTWGTVVAIADALDSTMTEVAKRADSAERRG